MTKKKTDKKDKQTLKVAKIKRSKYKCATTGKYSCDQCSKDINRGDTIRMVDVKYVDGLRDKFAFCSKDCRNTFCDGNGFPLPKASR